MAVGAGAVERAHRGQAGDLARIAHRDGDRVDRDGALPLELLVGKVALRATSAMMAERGVELAGRTVRPSCEPSQPAPLDERRAERLDRARRSRAAERVAVPSVITAAVSAGGAGAALRDRRPRRRATTSEAVTSGSARFCDGDRR